MHKKTLLIAGLMMAATPAGAAFDMSCGKASWYDLPSRTASGEMMDATELTAAHPSLPFGTRIKVTNQKNGRSVVVRINDRGPFVHSRIIDLSKAAAQRLSFVSRGVASVCISEKWADENPARVPLRKPVPAQG